MRPIFKIHEERWKRMAKLWDTFTEPGRPSNKDIDNYDIFIETALQGKTDPNILLLGSTPELRDLLYKYSTRLGARIVCADMTADMYKAMSEFVQNHNSKEEFIETNWLNIEMPDNSFDIVVGDYVIDNLTPEYQEQFLKKIRVLISDGEYFITRNCVVGENMRIVNAEEVFKKYALRFRDKQLTLKQASNYAAMELIWASYLKNSDKKNSLAYFESEIEKLNGAFEKGTPELSVFNYFLKSWWKMKDKYWTFNTASEDKNLIEKYFFIENIVYSDDYDLAKFSPIYLLKKKADY